MVELAELHILQLKVQTAALAFHLITGPRANARLTEERLDALKLSYIANRSERGREAVEQLTAQRKAKLLRMAGKKAEAEQVEKDLEAVRSSRRAAEGNGR